MAGAPRGDRIRGMLVRSRSGRLAAALFGGLPPGRPVLGRLVLGGLALGGCWVVAGAPGPGGFSGPVWALAPAARPGDAAVPSSSASVPADLAPRYRQFLEEVAPLMSARERAAFLALQRDYQREAFMKRFWQLRDPFPQTPRNELQEAWEERVAAARQRFGGLSDERARMLLLNGEPSHVLRSRCSEVLLPVEVWIYERSGGPGPHARFSLAFYQPLGAVGGAYVMWRPGEGIDRLETLDARVRAPQGMSLAALGAACPGGDEVVGALTSVVDWEQLDARLHIVPRPGDEWLTEFSSFSTEVPAGAAQLPASCEISFPGRYGSRTVAQGLVSVPKAGALAERLQGKDFYTFVVDGEVLLKDELFEHFRYRFSMPDSQAPGPVVPLVFQRYLRPGSYSLVLKVEDTTGKRFFREQRELEVPAVEAEPASAAALPAAGAGPAAPGSLAAAAPGAPGPASAPAGLASPAPFPAGPAAASPTLRALAEANAPLRGGEHSVRILPPRQGLLTGAVRVEAIAAGEGVARVKFVLDGRPVLAKARPPYSVDLTLGPQPRTHEVRAIALGTAGETLAEDQLVLNAGPHRFAVRLTEPQAGHFYRASLRAQAQVQVPEGEELERVEFYRNDVLVATLYQQPFAQPILLPKEGEMSVVRVVAYLAGGISAEDAQLVNSPNPEDRLPVDYVELYTTVADSKGRPVEGLTREQFRVFEDGAEQNISRFELVRDLPIFAGVMIDTSGSMETKLDAAVQGALGFFQEVVKPKDRAAVFSFNSQPNLLVRFTNNREVLAGGLAGLRAEGNTVLYDAIIEALYYFGGVKGKRAIILLTDGRDEGSKYGYNDALEYARRSGVSFYTVGIGLSSQDADVRFKLVRLAEETGGRSFFVEHAAGLKGIFATVERELRSQYLVGYQSSKATNDGKFRTVEVKLARPGCEAKTIHGYYP
jgi:Ca-activated chloride channel family protein